MSVEAGGRHVTALRGQALRVRSVIGSAPVRAVAMLSSGNGIAMLLPILAAPILSRLYTPSDYGVLAIFMMLTNVLGGIATLQLHPGIVADPSERQAQLLLRVAMVAALVVALLTVPVALVLAATVEVAGGWLLLLPPIIAAGGIVTAIKAYANRRAAYRALALIPVFGALVTIAVSIACGVDELGPDGLYLGYVAGQAVVLLLTLAIFARTLRRTRPQPLSARRVRLALRRHRGYLVWSLPSGFLDRVNREAPTYVLALLGDTAVLGAYTRGRQLLVLPIRLIGDAVAQVYFQRASESVRETGSCRRLWLKTFLCLSAFSVPGGAFLALIAPDLFAIVLGPDWRVAGEIAQILTPMLVASFVCAPLANTFFIRKRQNEDFWLMAATLGLLAVVGSATFVLSLAPKGGIALFAAVYCLVYTIYLVRSYQLSGGAPAKADTAGARGG